MILGNSMHSGNVRTFPGTVRSFLSRFFGKSPEPDFITFRGLRAEFDLAAYLATEQAGEQLRKMRKQLRSGRR